MGPSAGVKLKKEGAVQTTLMILKQLIRYIVFSYLSFGLGAQ